jgi:hypothetical protein
MSFLVMGLHDGDEPHRQSQPRAHRVRQFEALENDLGRRLVDEVRVAHEPRHLELRRALDLVHDPQDAFHRVGEGAALVDDHEQIVAPRRERRAETRQHGRADIVAADVHDTHPLAVLHHAFDFRHQDGQVGVHELLGGEHHLYPVRRQNFARLAAAKVGVHEVQIRHAHGDPGVGQRDGKVDGDLGLAAAVVADEEHNGLGVDDVVVPHLSSVPRSPGEWRSWATRASTLRQTGVGINQS